MPATRWFRVLQGIGVWCLVSAMGCFWGEAPADNRMIANFEKNRDGFESLLRMVGADSQMSIIAERYVSPDQELGSSFSEARWDEYKDVFDELDIQDVNTAWGDCFHFSSYAAGLATGGTIRGYAYCETTPALVRGSLDDLPPSLFPGTVYRAVDGPWYLFVFAD